MSEDGKIKVGQIEGSKDEVIVFLQKTGVDIPDYLNAGKAIKIPFWSIITASVLFIAILCIMVFVTDERVLLVLSIISVALGFLNIGLIYMCWKNKTLTCIIALGEVLVFSLSMHIYTPKDVIKKIEDRIEKIE